MIAEAVDRFFLDKDPYDKALRMSSESISSTSTGYRLWLADRGIHFDLPDADDAPRGGSVGGGNLFDGGTLRDASATQNINNFNLVSEDVVSPFVDSPFASGSVFRDSSPLRDTAAAVPTTVPTSAAASSESLAQYKALINSLLAEVDSLKTELAAQRNVNAAPALSVPDPPSPIDRGDYHPPQELASTSISSCGSVSTVSLGTVKSASERLRVTTTTGKRGAVLNLTLDRL